MGSPGFSNPQLPLVVKPGIFTAQRTIAHSRAWAPRDVQALAYEADGAETDGAETDGAETDGAETDGAETDGVVLWLANLTGAAQRVEISCLEVAGARLSLLDEDSFASWVAGPDGFDGNGGIVSGQGVALAPYAVARLDVSA